MDIHFTSADYALFTLAIMLGVYMGSKGAIMKIKPLWKYFIYIFTGVLALYSLLLMTDANATGGPPDCPPGHENINSCEDDDDDDDDNGGGDIYTGNIDINIDGTLGATSESSSTSLAASESNSNADAQATASATNAGNSVTINDVRPNSIKIKNVPNIASPNVYPTVSCFKGNSISVGLPGAGGSYGTGKIDDSCVERELIRMAAEMGMMDRATYMWCSQPHTVGRFGSMENCLQFEDGELQRILDDTRRKLEMCEESGRRKEKAIEECMRK